MKEAAKGKASNSSLVAEMKSGKLLVSKRKKLVVGEGSTSMTMSMATTAQEKATSGSSVVEIIEEGIMPEHSGRANEKLIEVPDPIRATATAKDSSSYVVGGEEEMMEVSDPMRRAIENGSCSSWVVEMEKMLEDARPSMEMARWKQQSIYRVPEFIKKTTNREAYEPQFVSLGPLHHGEPHLLPMEEHKRRAVLHLVARSGKPLQAFVTAIDEVADKLQSAYGGDLDDKWRGVNKGHFVEMMLTDGCFLFELLVAGRLYNEGRTNENYAANDPILGVRSFLTLWPILRDDMIAMENQVPLLVLESLLAVQGIPWSSRQINTMVALILNGPYFREDMDNLGLHFLDIYQKSHCGPFQRYEKSDKYEHCTPNAVELSEAGVQFKKSSTNNIRDVDFENGVLSMQLFVVDDCTERIFLNLMVFEWLHADVERGVRSYIWFMDDLIESERDVALLKSHGLIDSLVGSNKKVVEIFNTLTQLGEKPDNKLGHVAWKLSAHCRKRRNKWWANFVNTYMSNPWVFSSLVVAAILVVATLLQTIYTIVPFYTKG